MCRIPTIGPVRAERLLNDFGEDFLATMLVDNVSEFINLMDAKGNFVFSDRQAKRMERSMANIEFGFGEAATNRPSSSSATYLMATSTCWWWTRDMSTRTAARPRARPWAFSQPRHGKPCC